MKAQLQPSDVKLNILLKEARATPPLPPRFQAGVWRRIEDAEAQGTTGDRAGWLDRVAAWVVRPRFALTAAAALVVSGALLGALAGNRMAHQQAQTRYLDNVAPASLRQ